VAETSSQEAAPLPAGQAAHLIQLAARAPSLHNTQPWRFTVGQHAIELYADHGRQLPEDPAGREMLISCGAALYGLRLAVRSLGRVPEVDLFPGPVRRGHRRPLARVRLGAAVPVTPEEQKMLAAVPHRHTHRGPFEPGPLPDGLLPRLQQDAGEEGATLAVIEADQDLAEILAVASLRQAMDPGSQAGIERWTRDLDSPAKDGVPAHAFPATPDEPAGWLPLRDFDLGRGLGRLPANGQPAPVTAVLVTSGDGEEDWLCAGQALHRLLLRAASQWVFGNLQTQPLKVVWVRALIRNQLALPGWPQMMLQLGVARTTLSTGRRPAAELIDP
jgi:nitroreductase